MADKILYQDDWVTVLDRDGWTTVRDMGGAGVAILPYQLQEGKPWFLSRLEPCPAHGPKILPSCITGMLEEGEAPKACAMREVMEEAGYQVEEEALVPLGDVWPSKLVELRIHMFAVDVSGLTQGTAPGDGSRYEALGRTVWMDEIQALAVPDAVWGTMILRLLHKLRR